ncbi:MAG TPA: nucleotidyltransferase family protein [Candidatus Omnitrophota bacterium]|nr:nucleotidyltransferase family protein [Candidatus Omnitrophota bacterium]HPN66958.1 nucleotidyltransferase family protein [Candidatus Omnitrophota bacterium]HRZ67466.1 nucleotidyltransferase family protein [Candidatus Omnitrophota bacterium]
MKALILAAGYATRLYPLTKDRPKPLLLVGKGTIVDYLIKKLEEIPEIDTIYIVTNNKFYGIFNEWLKTCKSKVKIVIENDGSMTNDDRLGAIGDIRLVLEKQKVYDDMIVLAGDNMFDWSLKEFADFAKQKPEAFALGTYDLNDKAKAANTYGVVEVDANGDMVNFLEKPNDPPTSIIATGIYYFPQDKLSMIAQFLKVGNEKDAPGHLIQWISKEQEVRCYIFKGVWFDIGDLESYRKANLAFQEK